MNMNSNRVVILQGQGTELNHQILFQKRKRGTKEKGKRKANKNEMGIRSCHLDIMNRRKKSMQAVFKPKNGQLL